MLVQAFIAHARDAIIYIPIRARSDKPDRHLLKFTFATMARYIHIDVLNGVCTAYCCGSVQLTECMIDK